MSIALHERKQALENNNDKLRSKMAKETHKIKEDGDALHRDVQTKIG